MSDGSLTIKLDQKCKGSCSCKRIPANLEIEVEEEHDRPEKGYLKRVHKAKNGTFTLRSVRYNNEWVVGGGLGNSYSGVTEVAVYYGGPDLDIPFVIGIKRNSGNNYYFNSNPSIGSGNLVWEKKDDLNNLQNLKNKLEGLSCNATGTVVLDIYKRDFQKYHCQTRVRLSSHKFAGDDNNIYEFKQVSNKASFKVPYLRYDGKDINIQIPTEGVKEVSTFYWKYNFGRPLAVKVENKNGDIDYHFNNGRNKWEKKAKDKVGNLENAISEHNCRRNKATTINLSKRYGDYCCTEKCPNKRIIVKENSIKEIFDGFTTYEHKGIRGYSFTVDKIISNNEKQKGIKYPIHDVYEITVYYCTRCDREPIFIYMSYKVGGLMEYALYKRVTKNGWDLILDMPENEEEFYTQLKNHLEKLSDLLGMGCDLGGFENDKSEPRDKWLPSSPEETYEKLVKDAEKNKTSLPRGPPKDNLEEQEEKEVQEEDDRSKGQQNTAPLPPSKSGKVYPTAEKLKAIKKQVEEKERAKADLPSPSPVAAPLISPSSGVTINIKQNITIGNSTTYPGGPSGLIHLDKEEFPHNSGFLKFIHKSPDGDSFEVKRVEYDGKNVDVDVTGKNIGHLSVWYWKDMAGDMKNPLFIEVKKSDKQYDYHYNKDGTSWSPYRKDRPSPLDGEDLEKELDYLNCQHNGVVVMDLTESHSKTHASNGEGYCCGKNHNNRQKISVDKQDVFCQVSNHSSSSTIAAYKHVTSGTKFSKIKYYDDCGYDRKRIKISGLQASGNGLLSLYTFYCIGKDNPVLIYVDYSGQYLTGWYKKGTLDSDPWIKLNIELGNITPNNIKDCPSWNALVKALNEANCGSFRNCPIPPPLPGGAGFSPLGPSGDKGESSDGKSAGKGSGAGVGGLGRKMSRTTSTISNGSPSWDWDSLSGRLFANVISNQIQSSLQNSGKTEAGEGGGANLKAQEPPADSSQNPQPTEHPTTDTIQGEDSQDSGAAGATDPPAVSEEGTPGLTPPATTASGDGQTAQPFVEPGSATGLYAVISGISSGTLTGAGGLTGLGWWAFKRSKGDPVY